MEELYKPFLGKTIEASFIKSMLDIIYSSISSFRRVGKGIFKGEVSIRTEKSLGNRHNQKVYSANAEI
jgi:hypothetical protein